MKQIQPYKPKNKIRIVTAASLFDGHDVSINIMRRIMQATGVEVIHLGHDRSAEEVVNTAIQEDAHAICMTSYQGGHNEYFKYMFDLLNEKGRSNIRIFGGGGGVILPEEIQSLMAYGITRLYSPDDGREMGLQGMINDLVQKSDFAIGDSFKGSIKELETRSMGTIARLISCAENFPKVAEPILKKIHNKNRKSTIPVLGITGTGGAGKSSLVDEIVRRFLADFPKKTLGIISVDPSKRKTGGALLGDRIRMNAINDSRVYMRSLATRRSNLALSKHVNEAVQILKAAEFDLVILETSGIGQSDTEILEHSDVSLYVMTPEFGAATQLEKIDMLDFADLVAINKFDKRGAQDALRDVKKQYVRNLGLWDVDDAQLPIYGTIASQFNDLGTSTLYKAVIEKITEKTDASLKSSLSISSDAGNKIYVIPPARTRYLAEITENNRAYDQRCQEQAAIAEQLYGIYKTLESVSGTAPKLREHGIEPQSIPPKEAKKKDFVTSLENEFERVKMNLDPLNWQAIINWNEKAKAYKGPSYTFNVRGKELKIETHSESLAHSMMPKVCLPKYKAWGDLLGWERQENVPGEFPFTAGLYPFKRTSEDPTRMFAGEGGPERTNRRFHYLSQGMPAKRLSTAFDSVTLYGRDPDYRPDIYGKIGNAGVSICCLDDAKKLYSGFDLIDSMTSVSMTINGPAPMMLAYYMNAAIDQQCEVYILENGLESQVESKIVKIYNDKNTERPKYHGKLPQGNNGLGLFLLGVTGDQVLPTKTYSEIKAKTIAKVRGTVQADILKEDQAQNTCIFSTEFALRLMGDVQEYFIENDIRNFYSVSISGYHIAEAGANPITQLALTLSNGFTYVEYYLARGMDIDKFAPNLSFFFSNGLDPEYAVIGRVARRIWAKAMKYKYGAAPRAQMLKYHIQTSGRSLHAQEIDFNDIRTTLQALYAIYDNCNSLHTNAYDEAITTPTEDSVRRAMAIQLIINKELGLTKNENPLQGSFIIEALTNLVEEAVLIEFDRISERGGVMGAMETMYQRNKIQEESLHYETLKHNGTIQIVGVNTFLSSKGSRTTAPPEVIRATKQEKEQQIGALQNLHRTFDTDAPLNSLKEVAVQNGNIFESLMEVCKSCSLGQITSTLFEVGGQYRRNM